MDTFIRQLPELTLKDRSMNPKERHLNYLGWILGLALVPLLAVLIFAVIVFVQRYDRYDEALFTSAYQERYRAPFIVSGLLVEVLQTGNDGLYEELTGLRKTPAIPEVNPDIIYGVLLEVDEAEYFHYMFIDKNTFKRSMYFLEEIDGRWVVAPEDVYFLYHSGEWLKAFLPLTIVYLLILLVIGTGIGVYRMTAKIREERFG